MIITNKNTNFIKAKIYLDKLMKYNWDFDRLNRNISRSNRQPLFRIIIKKLK